MPTGLYFIGGASGAGKTTSAKELSGRFNLPLIELDDFQRLIMPALPSLDERSAAMRRIAQLVICELLDARSTCLVDGAWIEPKEAAQLRTIYGAWFHPVFCGYHDSELAVRHAKMNEQGRHWLSREPHEKALAFLLKQREHSASFREKCNQLGICYIDFTSFEGGFRTLEADFQTWFDSRDPSSPSGISGVLRV